MLQEYIITISDTRYYFNFCETANFFQPKRDDNRSFDK